MSAGLFSDDGVLFAETVASGGVVVGCGGDPGFGVLRHGFLESSNVWFDTELSSLNSAAQAIRTYIRVEDELLSTTKDIRR
jgi:flagellar basal-body rod protein FlgG